MVSDAEEEFWEIDSSLTRTAYVAAFKEEPGFERSYKLFMTSILRAFVLSFKLISESV